MILALFLCALLLLMMIGFPIAMSLGLISIFFIMFYDIPLQMISQKLLGGVNSTSLLAIPLFILAGDLMSKGGMAERMIHLAFLLVGRLRGGLAIVTILACMFFAAISGSGVATAAALGTVMIPSMVKAGYDRGYAGALVATASPIGVIIPPSISFIVYASITGVSVVDLYRAGIPAGLIMGMALMLTAYFFSKVSEQEPLSEEQEADQGMKVGLEIIWALGTPLILIGGVFGGIFTPTESAVVAVFYALFISLFIYKDIGFRDLPKILYSSAKTTSMIMFIIANASLFAWVLISQQIPQQIAQFFLSISESPFLILLLINLVILLIGCFLETGAILIVVVPLFLPIVTGLGLDPVHFGILVTINTAIGLATPPFGVSLYTTASVGQMDIMRLMKYLAVPLVAMIIVLLLVTYFPQLILFMV